LLTAEDLQHLEANNQPKETVQRESEGDEESDISASRAMRHLKKLLRAPELFKKQLQQSKIMISTT
jgi:hypothetical protein